MEVICFSRARPIDSKFSGFLVCGVAESLTVTAFEHPVKSVRGPHELRRHVRWRPDAGGREGRALQNLARGSHCWVILPSLPPPLSLLFPPTLPVSVLSLPASRPPGLPASLPPGLPASRPPGLPASRPCLPASPPPRLPASLPPSEAAHHPPQSGRPGSHP